MPGNKRTYNKRKSSKPKKTVSQMGTAAPTSKANLITQES